VLQYTSISSSRTSRQQNNNIALKKYADREGEDRLFKMDSLQQQLGDKWSIIAAQFPGLSDNDLKNHDGYADIKSPKRKAAGVERMANASPRKKARVINNQTTATTTGAPKAEAQNTICPTLSLETKGGGDESLTIQMSSGEGDTHSSSDDTQEQPPVKAEQWDRNNNTPWPMDNIISPGINDCLMGRGGGTNHHPGNKRYRAMTENKKPKYLASKRLDKPIVAMEIINEWRALEPPGRFLKQNDATKLWYDVGDQKAREKTSQALREKIAYSMVDEDGVMEQTTDMDPEEKKGVWTEAEMELVRDAQKELGNKWNEVAKRIPGRSEISVKNWWYNHQTSEKRKRKKLLEEVPKVPSDRSLSSKYNLALIASSYGGQQENKESPPDNWTSYYGEEISPRTALYIPEASSSIEGTRSISQGMSGGTNDCERSEFSSDEDCEFGAIGYKFSRQLEDENGEDLGWYDGKVVDILSETEKDRRCLYFANGFIEDLSMTDLKELAQLESK